MAEVLQCNRCKATSRPTTGWMWLTPRTKRRLLEISLHRITDWSSDALSRYHLCPTCRQDFKVFLQPGSEVLPPKPDARSRS